MHYFYIFLRACKYKEKNQIHRRPNDHQEFLLDPNHGLPVMFYAFALPLLWHAFFTALHVLGFDQQRYQNAPKGYVYKYEQLQA